MRLLKILVSLFFLGMITISCDPEEIPLSSNLDNDNITAGTDDQVGDEYRDQKRKNND